MCFCVHACVCLCVYIRVNLTILVSEKTLRTSVLHLSISILGSSEGTIYLKRPAKLAWVAVLKAQKKDLDPFETVQCCPLVAELGTCALMTVALFREVRLVL